MGLALERVEFVVKERDRVRGALLADGWTVPETEANFVWLRLGDRTTEFAESCDAAGISAVLTQSVNKAVSNVAVSSSANPSS